MKVYIKTGQTGSCKWKANADIAGPIFCNKLNSNKCHLFVNKANLVHNLFLVYLPISKRFGRLCADHSEKQLCLCDTWYLLFTE